MNTKELAILDLADYYELIKYKNSSAYLIINKKIAEYQCMFGFAKMSNDFNEVQELYSRIESRAKELGYNELIGPLNYTTWMSYRWAINNFEKKYYPDCDNDKYYVDFIKRLGYKELYTYRSAIIDINNKLYYIGKDIYNQKLLEGYEFKFFKGNDAYKLVQQIYNISIDAFKGSYLYSEIPFAYFNEIYIEWTRKIKDIAVYMAYKNNEPIGYVMGYVNPYNSNEFIAKTSAVLKKYQKHKVYVALLYLACTYVKGLGFNTMVYHFQCEQKDTFRRFDNNIESNEKRYAVFMKKL